MLIQNLDLSLSDSRLLKLHHCASFRSPSGLYKTVFFSHTAFICLNVTMSSKRKFTCDCVQCDGNTICISSETDSATEEVHVTSTCGMDKKSVGKTMKNVEAIGESQLDIQIIEVDSGSVARKVEIIKKEDNKEDDVKVLKVIPGKKCVRGKGISVDVSDCQALKIKKVEKSVKSKDEQSIDLTSPPPPSNNSISIIRCVLILIFQIDNVYFKSTLIKHFVINFPLFLYRNEKAKIICISG